MERTQVASKIIYFISLMNIVEKEEPFPLGYKLTHYIVTGGRFIFHLKNRLIILRVVTYVIHERMCFRAARDRSRNYWLTIFFETAVG